jgi:methanogenic corrinoid protein MtbC1
MQAPPRTPTADEGPAVLRIGEVARRTGVAVATLRAWETRYGLLVPERTEGGHRLYREADVARVDAVRRLVAQGWAPARAAREVGGGSATIHPLRALEGGRARDDEDGEDDDAAHAAAARLAARLEDAIRRLDAVEADGAIDDAFARFRLARALEEVVAPVLRRIGEGWEDDARLIAEEHFATNVLRPRLARLVRTVRRADAPRCLAFAPAGEDHELGLLAAAVVAADEGFAVTYLGARTPAVAVERALEGMTVDVVLVGAMTRAGGASFVTAPPRIGRARLVIGGAGFVADDLARLPGDVRLAPSLAALPQVLADALAARGATG